jgi:hypothetical protein
VFGLNRVRFEELTDLVGLDVELLGEGSPPEWYARW